MFIIGARSLNKTLKCIPYRSKSKRQLVGKTYSIGGLSFIRTGKNPLKILQNFLIGREVLAKKFKIVIWHDVINLTISKHKSNNYAATTVEEQGTRSQRRRIRSHRVSARDKKCQQENN